MRTYLKPQSQASQVLLGSRVGRTTYAQTLHFASTISAWYPQWPMPICGGPKPTLDTRSAPSGSKVIAVAPSRFHQDRYPKEILAEDTAEVRGVRSDFLPV